jgi:uncharacterized iron-regulated membrane protein
MSDLHSSTATKTSKRRLHYTTVWRWHFYAGLLCIPFILWLSCTGLIYLFKPQIDAWYDRPYDHLSIQQVQPASKQVEAALNAVPEAVFSAYEMPPSAEAATRVLLAHNEQILKVYVHPETLEVLKVINQNDEFTRKIFLLHGEFMLGDTGSHIMQIAAGWTVVLIITGLFMWWAKGGKFKAAGMLYPRLSRKDRAFWKDLHSVLGFWISLIVLFLIITGLPWSASWGTMLKNMREWSTQHEVRQEWVSSNQAESEQQQRVYTQTLKQQQAADSTQEDSEAKAAAHHGGMIHATELSVQDQDILNRIVERTPQFEMAYPVIVKPEIMAMQQPWSVESQSQNRTLREKVSFDSNGNITEHKQFADQLLLDRMIGYGVAIHEGRYFGWLNVVIGVVTLLSLILICNSAFEMWLRRKPAHVLGAPPLILTQKLSWSVRIAMIMLGIVLPLLGLSIIFILILEKCVLSRIPKVAHFLGLGRAG